MRWLYASIAIIKTALLLLSFRKGRLPVETSNVGAEETQNDSSTPALLKPAGVNPSKEKQ